jgi:SPP1 family predicted phage head-tail adaptor
MKSDVITLISKPFPDLPAVMNNVYANILPVKRTEFYRAKSMGLIPSYIFSIFEYDYNGENRVIYNDKLYAVARAYGTSNEKIELTCAGIELGEYNCKIIIVRPNYSKDSDGFAIKTYTTLGEFYAFKEEQKDTENESDNGTFAFNNLIFRFEKPLEFIIDNDCEILLETVYYNISSVSEILGREEFIEVISKGKV